MGLEPLPQEIRFARLCGAPAGGAFFLVVKLKCVTLRGTSKRGHAISRKEGWKAPLFAYICGT